MGVQLRENYAYDTSGRIENAAFAQTPQTNYTPPSGSRWYSTSEEPASRCREFFDFDPAGRNLNLQYMWETFAASGTSPASVTNITGWNYTYEADLTNQNLNQDRGLKTNASLYSGTGTSWVLDHTENYTYEAQRGFLIGAQYNDGQPNASPTWTYNESQNRTDTATNDLNQAGSFSGSTWNSYTDQAGRTLTRGSATLGWDCVSQLTSYTTSSGTSNYEYRADGMRDHRTSVWYPVYDGHGNQCGTLARSTNNAYTFSNVRTFDAWGNVRRGAATGDPASRYCGSLGHVQDDESLLVYMRARFYDPSSGRFTSEDPAEQGQNWVAYGANDPINHVDSTGRGWLSVGAALQAFMYAMAAALLTSWLFGDAVGAGVLVFGTLIALLAGVKPINDAFNSIDGIGPMLKEIETEANALNSPTERAAEDSEAGPAVLGCAAEVGAIEGELLADAVETFSDGGGI